MKNRLFKKLTAAATAFVMIGGAVSVPFVNFSLITANAENDLDNKLAGTENEFTAIYDEVRNVLTISGNVDRSTLLQYQKFPDLTIIAAKGTILPEDCSGLFYWFLAKTIDLSNADASTVKNMGYMFQSCSNLTSVDLENLNTQNVTDMSNMFYNCTSLESVDMRGFVTSNVENMAWMFHSCPSLKSLDLGSFDTSNVEIMSEMFYSCSSLESLNISSFDTSKSKTFMAMFADCENLESLDLSSFTVNNTSYTNGMFYNCTALEPSICTIDKIVSLDGNTGVDFYLNPCEKLAKVVMSGPNGDKEITDFSGVKQEDGTYKFTYSINATQADKLITFKAYDKDGNRLIICDKEMGLLDHSQASNGNIDDIKKDVTSDVNTYNGHTYKIFDKSETWRDAYAFCQNVGGHLVTISDQNEQDYIEQLLNKKSDNKNCYWIGLYNDDELRYLESDPINWKWADDTLFNYTNWSTNEPNNEIGLEKYVHIFGKTYSNGKGPHEIGQWNDASNEGAGYADDFYNLENFGFICEWDYCISNEKKDPIILIPGIMGSRLFNDEECTKLVWPPDAPLIDIIGLISDLRYLNKNCENDTLYVKDAKINQQSLSFSEREYGAQNSMKYLVDHICTAFPKNEVYVFSYDWRKSNAESALKLKKFIDSLNTEKVDIVAHSMGGLVVSSYFKKYGQEGKVDKIITCATPYEGAPHVLDVVQNGSVTDNWITNSALSTLGGFTFQAKSGLDGVAELIPSKQYCAACPMIVLEGQDFYKSHRHSMSYDEYKKAIVSTFGEDIAKRTFDFQNSILDSNYNCLCSYDKSYYAIGCNQHTPKAAIYDCSGDYEFCVDVEFENDGDGTVPYLSATMADNLSSQVDETRIKEVEATHLGIIKNKEVISWIIDILNDAEPILSDSSIDKSGFSVLRVACPVDVEIGNGNDKLSSVSGEEAFESSFGRLDIIGKDNDIKMICMDEDTNLDINLTGTDTGTMDFTVRHFSADEELLDECTFENVPITNKTIIKTKADNNEVTVLSIDNDGDGVVDATWTAKKNETITAPDATIVTTTTNISTCSVTTTTTKATTTATATADKRIVGSWYVSHVTIKTDSYDFTDDKGVVIFNNDFTVEAQSKITIDSDGKLHENDEYWIKKGTWAIKGDKYFATPSDIKETEFTYDEATDTISVRLTDAYLVMKRGGKITSTINLGDVNNDGLINAVDASIVLTYYAMMSTNQKDSFDDNQKSASDVNHDGLINAVDASCILSYYAYISTTREEIKSIEEFLKK